MELINNIETLVYEIRGQKVMLDSDLAKLYQVETKVLNQAVKRNIDRFPKDFMFQLTNEEEKSLRSQIVTLDNENEKSLRGRHKKYNSYVFTEHGIAMLSSVLKSKLAIEINIQIMRTFTKMREFALNYKDIVLELRDFKDEVNKRLSENEKDTKQNKEHIQKAFEFLYQILDDTSKTDKNLIGFRPK